jgi:protein SCO1/2
MQPDPCKTTRRAALTLVLAAASGGLAACFENKEAFFSIDITGADYADGFKLRDHNGIERSLADFKGKVVVLFFGYTQCPDVCPTVLAELAELKKKLGKDGERLQGLFVTLDPERDSAEVLKAYMVNFDPSFLALRGNLEQTAEVARRYKLFYKKVEGRSEGSYTLDHSTGSYVYDTQGRIRLYTRHGSGSDGLLADLKILLK